MHEDKSKNSKKFIIDYFKSYSNRDLSICDLYEDDFIGLDGISTKIYNRITWIQALKHDFQEIQKPFDIKITDLDMRTDENGQIIAAVISLWCIPIFENSPEFDKMRTILILRPCRESFKITHLSNSISLLPLNQEDVYPTDLLSFLKSYKESIVGKIRNDSNQ